jgi:hypothetical protein
MGSERIACGLPTVTSPSKGQAGEYDKKIFPCIKIPCGLPQGIFNHKSRVMSHDSRVTENFH